MSIKDYPPVTTSRIETADATSARLALINILAIWPRTFKESHDTEEEQRRLQSLHDQDLLTDDFDPVDLMVAVEKPRQISRPFIRADTAKFIINADTNDPSLALLVGQLARPAI